MCGIAGILDRRFTNEAAELERRARTMGRTLAHRGPDGEGIHIEVAHGLAFTHRRLAIVDLSPAGAQPMVSADGRYIICYNGEIYNAEDLRREPDLASVAWRGHSDTEVILELVARRGLEATVPHLNGMFAIALWDRKNAALHLARDHLGIKPLFYEAGLQGIAFGSELKALFATGDRPRVIDTSAVASFLRLAYVPAPYTIFQNVLKLMPGTLARITLPPSGPPQVATRSYWSLADVARRGIETPLDVSDQEAVSQLTKLLLDAVSRQMMGDVPLGAFLSGGIDSSTVAAMMVAAGKGPVRTYSIGFDEAGFDEAPFAAAVARHLGTAHEELRARPQDALDLVPRLAEFYDEPFADSSQIPTMLLSKLTRQHVTVALSGDGGDELFAGYNRYRVAEQFAARIEKLPMIARKAASAALRSIPSSAYDRVALSLPASLRVPLAGDKAHKVASVLSLDAQRFYERLVSQIANPETIAPRLRAYPLANWDSPEITALPTLLDKMQYLDTSTYLPDDILQKVDRASMSVALEARPPLLDLRVVEFAWRLPRRMKIRNGETKWILRKVLEQFVPRPLIERPKVGFGIPLAEWLRGPLRGWANDLLDEARRSNDLLDGDAVTKLWQDHLGNKNNAYGLWNILMFEQWRRTWARKA